MTKTKENPVPTPQDAWDKIWAPLLVKDNGDLDLDGVKRLLFDYGGMLHDLTILYAYLTEGNVTHPQSPVHEVMVESDLYLTRSVDAAIQQILNELLDAIEPFNTSDCETQLSILLDKMNKIYERGDNDVE